MTQAPGIERYRLLVATALAAALFSLSSSPAFADKNDKHQRNQQRNDQHHYQNNQSARGWHGEREVYSYQPTYRRPYAYAQPVYVPSPIYYEPRQSVGVSLFFPLEFRR